MMINNLDHVQSAQRRKREGKKSIKMTENNDVIVCWMGVWQAFITVII